MTNEQDFLAGMFSTDPAASLETPTTPPSLDDVPPTDPPTHEEESSEIPFEEEPVVVDESLVSYVAFLKHNDLIDIPEDLEFTGEASQLEKIFSHTKTAREAQAVDKVFQALPEDFKPLLDYALKGGKSLNEFLSVYAADPLENVDLTNVNDQKKIIAQHYKATSNYTDEKINRLVSLITDEDDLRIEAEDCYKELSALKETEKKDLLIRTEQQVKENEEKIQAQTLALSKAVETTTTIHPQRKQKVRSFFFDPVNIAGNTTTGFNYAVQSILSNPEHQAQLADILLEYNPATGFSSERLEKRAKTKATETFQALLEKTLNPKSAQRSSSSKTPNSTTLDWDNYLKQ